MGNRLSKIVTKTGDNGTTGLSRKIRVPKNHLRVEAIGTIDELNSHIGLLIAYLEALKLTALSAEMQIVQHRLFDLGSELVIPEHETINEARIDQIETWIIDHNEPLTLLKEFILPSGSFAISYAHICRTVTRRAERVLVSLNQQEPINANILKYINRLSDYFFVIARVIAKESDTPEVYWMNIK